MSLIINCILLLITLTSLIYRWYFLKKQIPISKNKHKFLQATAIVPLFITTIWFFYENTEIVFDFIIELLILFLICIFVFFLGKFEKQNKIHIYFAVYFAAIFLFFVGYFINNFLLDEIKYTHLIILTIMNGRLIYHKWNEEKLKSLVKLGGFVLIYCLSLYGLFVLFQEPFGGTSKPMDAVRTYLIHDLGVEKRQIEKMVSLSYPGEVGQEIMVRLEGERSMLLLQYQYGNIKLDARSKKLFEKWRRENQ